MQVRRLACLVSLSWCLLSSPASSQTLPGMEKLPAQKGCEGGRNALDVSSERMTYESKARTFVFESKVRILRCAMIIDCDRLQVINDATEKNVERIVATGNVRFQQGTRYATAERADYSEAEQKLVLQGNPRVWDTQESNELKGTEITMLLREEKMFVKDARVVFQAKPPAKTP